MRILAPFAVRTLVLSVVYVVALVLIDASDGTDPLGAGLLVFLAFVILALVWGLVDGRRGPAVRAILVWLLAGAALGIVTTIGIAVQDSESGVVEDLVFSIPFFAVMIGVPAAIGVGIGTLLRRASL
ncbi:MAG: hypothetical protein ACXWYU_14555 [Actinomycetota bacterium]